MGDVPAPANIARYLRFERADAPTRANREVALSNLMNVAIERGEIDANPCKQVKKNREHARTEAPEPQVLSSFLDWLFRSGPASRTLALMAEFAALSGSLRTEFLEIRQIRQIDMNSGFIWLNRAKQHGNSKKVKNIIIIPAMLNLAIRLLALPRPNTSLHVPMAESCFTTGWQRAMVTALKEGVIKRRFIFHDLRAYYTTQFKEQHGTLPELHANAGDYRTGL